MYVKIYDFKDLRPIPTYPTYPCYHQGKYLEDYFFDFYIKNKEQFDAKGRTLIPVSWTTLYVENTPINIQEYLDQLDPNGAYFTVVQHDEGIRQRLPANTLVFEAGGLGNGIPIPLVCSSLQHNSDLVRKIEYLCSFVGSMTHPIRQMLYRAYHERDLKYKNFHFSVQDWNQSVPENRLAYFVDITTQSAFTLCPRGYGATSFRLYEAMQLNSVPVYVSDKHWLPWKDVLNWEEFAVILKPEDIPDIYEILADIYIDRARYQRMLTKGKEIYNDYFSLEGVCKQILKRL
jgi:hypothetical protein